MLARTLALTLFLAPLTRADDGWPQFRGPAGTGQAAGKAPSEWSKDKNVAWKADLPGVGWSSPAVAGGRVFVTTAVTDKQPKAAKFTAGGFDLGAMMGTKKPPEAEYRWEVLCLDRKTGKELWRKECVRKRPDVPIHPSNTYATESPATDGERVYAYFGPAGVLVCLSADGKELWRKTYDPAPISVGFGTGSSPALADGRLFVQRDNEKKSFLVAYDASTGNELWRVNRDGKSSWSTPLVWRNKARAELVACNDKGVTSYDPATGKELWRMGGMPTTFTASPAADADRLYFGTSSPTALAILAAVNAGASGDITLKKDESSSEFVAWTVKNSAPGLSSPVVHDGRLYLTPTGFVVCHDAKTGERVFRERLPGGKSMAASPLVAGGRLFVLDEDGNTFVLSAGPKYERIATNRLEGTFWSTPALAGGELFLRSADRLYCVRE